MKAIACPGPATENDSARRARGGLEAQKVRKRRIIMRQQWHNAGIRIRQTTAPKVMAGSCVDCVDCLGCCHLFFEKKKSTSPRRTRTRTTKRATKTKKAVRSPVLLVLPVVVIANSTNELDHAQPYSKTVTAPLSINRSHAISGPAFFTSLFLSAT